MTKTIEIITNLIYMSGFFALLTFTINAIINA